MKKLKKITLFKKLVLFLFGSLCLLLALTTVEGQRSEWESEWATIGEPMELMKPDIFPGNEFTFARIHYTFRRRGRFGRSGQLGELQDASDGVILRGFWATDYPEADENFSLRLSQITTLNVSRKEDEESLSQVLPPEEYPLVKVPLDHAIFHMVFDVKEVPQVPDVGFF